MKIIDNYLFDLDGDEFLLRSFDYHQTKKKINKYPLVHLDKIYILEIEEELQQMYDLLQEDTIYIIICVKMERKKVFFTYPVLDDSPQLTMFWKFYNNKIDRRKRTKIIPYIKDNRSFLMKNNKPVLIAKKINVEFEKFNNIIQMNIVLNKNFLVRKVLKYILSKDKSVYVGLTIETYEEDLCEEELLCIFGLNNLRELNDVNYKSL